MNTFTNFLPLLLYSDICTSVYMLMNLVSVAQSCLILATPGSSLHGIFQARVLEWGAIAFSTSLIFTLIFVFLFSTNFGFCLFFFF